MHVYLYFLVTSLEKLQENCIKLFHLFVSYLNSCLEFVTIIDYVYNKYYNQSFPSHLLSFKLDAFPKKKKKYYSDYHIYYMFIKVYPSLSSA